MANMNEKSEASMAKASSDELPAPSTGNGARRRDGAKWSTSRPFWLAAGILCIVLTGLTILVGVNMIEDNLKYNTLVDKYNALVLNANGPIQGLGPRDLLHQEPEDRLSTTTVETTTTATIVVPVTVEASAAESFVETTTVTDEITSTISLVPGAQTIPPTFDSTVTVTTLIPTDTELASALPISDTPCDCVIVTETLTLHNSPLAGYPAGPGSEQQLSTVELTTVFTTRSETVTAESTTTATIDESEQTTSDAAPVGGSSALSSESTTHVQMLTRTHTESRTVFETTFLGTGALPPLSAATSALQTAAPFRNVTTTTVTGFATGSFRPTPTPLATPIMSGGSPSRPRPKGDNGNSGGTTYCIVMLVAAMAPLVLF